MARKLLWIGLAAPDNIYSDLVSKGYSHAAAQNAQRSIISGIESVTNEKFDLISGFMMRPYPHGKLLVTKRCSWENGSGKGIGTSCINIKYIDVLTRMHNMKIACRKWAKQHLNDEVIIFVYSAINAYVQAALEVKKIISNAKIYLIITDLPQYMELRPTRLKKMLKEADWKSLYKGIKSCDGWILFTKHMITYLDLPQEKCIVMEGSIDLNRLKLIDNPIKSNKISIMYSGSLNLDYGIPLLLEAFHMIEDENYELWLTGSGNAENMIQEFCKKDSRIKMFGFLPTKNDLIRLQNEATMLINMRLPTEPASAYCFPSKLFEYMLTGKPVLSFKIDGIPNEYYQYLVIMETVDTEGIANAIKRTAKMKEEERKIFGESGREFIKDKKNNITQAQRICDFFDIKKIN